MHKRGIMSKYTIQKIILKRKKIVFYLLDYCCGVIVVTTVL